MQLIPPWCPPSGWMAPGGWHCLEARRMKEYPELAGNGGRARLMVVAAEVGGRFSAETNQFLRGLVSTKVRGVPGTMRLHVLSLNCSAPSAIFDVNSSTRAVFPSTSASCRSVCPSSIHWQSSTGSNLASLDEPTSCSPEICWRTRGRSSVTLVPPTRPPVRADT